jgi:hypothetical protein
MLNAEKAGRVIPSALIRNSAFRIQISNRPVLMPTDSVWHSNF